MKVKNVDVVDIQIGDRFREEYGDLEALAISIKEHNILQPLTVDEDLNLLAGGRRLAAAILAGMSKVPVVIRKVSSELTAREIELIENTYRKDFVWSERAKLEKRIFELKKEKDPNWTQDKQAELTEGSKGAVNRRLHLAEMLDVIPELEECKTEDEAYKKLKSLEEAVITQSMIDNSDERFKKAAKYAADHYKIGDAFEGIVKVNNGVVGFVEVDPPYAVQLDKRKGRNQDQQPIGNYNEVSREDYPEFIENMMIECFRIIQPNSFMIWWFGPEWYATVLSHLTKAGFKVNSIPAIWVKGIAGQTASPDTMLGSSYEPFFVCRKGEPKLRKPGTSNVFMHDPVPPQHKVHPTERPLTLMEDIIQTFCFPSQVVCIPFLGSGVTLRAAYKNNCTGYGWDFDEMCKTRFVNAVYKDITENKE